jgi:prophage DNA circulation protein
MDVKSLLIRIGVDTSELERGLDNTQKKLESHKKAFRDIGASMTVVGGVLTAFFTKSIEESARSEAQTTKLKTALSNVAGAAKNGAEMLVKYASSLQSSTGYSDDEIKSGRSRRSPRGFSTWRPRRRKRRASRPTSSP